MSDNGNFATERAAATQRPSPGRIVHIFDRKLEGHQPQRIGPYPAVVTFVHADGMTIDATGFPSRTFGDVQGVPASNGDANEGLTVWWAWPERVS